MVGADRPCPLPRKLLQRGPEIRRRKAVQIQQRQHLRHLRRLPRPGRQDRRGKSHPLTGHRVDPLVVDPRLPHRHRPGRRRHLPLSVVAVADHQPVTVLVQLPSMRLDVGDHLGPQPRSQHLPRTVTHDLIQQRRPQRRHARRVGLRLVVDYRERRRTFPNRRPNAGPDQMHLDFRSSSGRCASSRHLAEGYPQVLIIAPGSSRPGRTYEQATAG
jgi:hypothetical protein